jgi:ferric-dicitrate binding protein FerR (iron transport regulator)
MNERQGSGLTPDEKRTCEAVRALPRVDADPAFRQRLKADFVAGRLCEGTGGAKKRRAPRRWFLRPGLLVPVAVAVILIFAGVLNRGPALQLADVAGEGTVTVNGKVFETSNRDGIEQAIRPGSRVELSDGVAVDVLYAETAVYQLASATATIPKAPGRWFGKAGEGWLEKGEFQVLTGPGFEGAGLTIQTSEGIIQVTGTLLSVVKDAEVTCVCVHHGTARVGIDTEDLEDIPAGKRKVMFADGRPPIVTPIAPPHQDHLVEFESKYKSGIR